MTIGSSTSHPEPPDATLSDDGAKRAAEANRVTLLGSVANLVLTAAKFAAGVLGNSAAMIADSVHSLSDFGTDLVVLITTGIAKKPRDADHNYGHGKFETLGSLVIGGALLAVGVGLAVSSGRSIVSVIRGAVLPEPGLIALAAAVLSIVVKEILYQVTVRCGRKIRSSAVIANAWHHRSDALSSIGALAGIGGAILLGEKYTVLDPVAGLVVSVIICVSAGKILRDCVVQLSEGSVEPILREEILEEVTAIPGVEDPHNLRARWVGSQLALDLHIRVDGGMTVTEGHGIASRVEAALRRRFGAQTMMNIHIEPRKIE